MDKKTDKLLSIILWVFLAWSSIYIFTYKGNNIIMLSILLTLLCTSLLLSTSLGKKLNIKNSAYRITVFIDCALIYWIALVDISGASQILFYILTGSMIIQFSLKYGLLFTGINFLSFAIIDYIKLGYPSISVMLPKVLSNLFSFGFVFGFCTVAKLEILQSESLAKTKKELERAYEKLQESYDTKEQLLIERERNKIAGEIHDTVGHTLTTVIVELEAAKRLMKKNMDLSLEKLDLAQEQVRKGLNDIRKSVRALKANEEVLELLPSIESLIKETQKHSGVTINYTIDTIKFSDNDISKVLLRALQEGLTNGIRHGQSSEFKLTISEKDNSVIFNLSDNGSGVEKMEYGFGLSNMKHRVEQLNGKLEVNSKKNQGLSVHIEIPMVKVEEHGEN